jgi:predicted phage terminase large subunit-like protein
MSELFYQVCNIARKENGNNLQTINDLFYLCKNELEKGDKNKGLKYCKSLKNLIDDLIKGQKCLNKAKIYNKIFDILVLETPYSFDSYFQALEWERPVEEQFYLPRREVLMKHGIIQALEDLIINDKLDELLISLPVRVGKTTLANLVVSWIVGVRPNEANLYCSNSGIICNAFYEGIKTILDDDYTYQWSKIFPKVKFNPREMCNAKDTQLDTGKIKRYHSFTARSIDGTLNGSVDVSNGGILIADDMCSGIEEAMNVNRLRSLWLKVNSDMLSRAKQKAKILWIGTRWSIYDPIGVRLNMLENGNSRWKNIVVPALDENDESNFNYLYNVGFDTEYYRNKRATYESSDDIASWKAIYQGEPIERSGLLFPIEEEKTFDGELPDVLPTNKYAFCDIAWGGGDYTCMPIVYQYGSDGYVVDFVFDNNNKKITQPKVVERIIKYDLPRVKFEKNNGGDGYKEDVGRLLKERNFPCLLVSGFASNQQTKEMKIFNHAPEIKQFYFLTPSKRSNEYSRAMEQLHSFTIQGKNKHDDCPDALAEICEMINEIVKKTSYQVFERFF